MSSVSAIGFFATWRGAETAPDSSPPASKTPVSLGPLPLALHDEPVQPAHLSGQIESAGIENRRVDPLSGGAEAESSGTTCEPPPLGDDPWRPSARMASYQSPSNDEPASIPAPRSAATAARPEPSPTPVYASHRIVDGDTLSGLAARYLGSSKRFNEIFEANRDRLPSPDLLPIGVVLRIPTESAKGAPMAGETK
ncbi:MAG TPA: LysM peptidoglycan-binding domain-containing protein [Pirellulales bacterium]|nr:LysM peptidoglycan-binding domain-containing protein [Pirellulales bacterium]